MPPEPALAPGDNRVVRELVALTLVALAIFAVLSLVSAAAGRNPNLCGIAGDAAARAMGRMFGVQAYVLAVLVLALARRVWNGAPARILARESLGGALVLIALSAGA